MRSLLAALLMLLSAFVSAADNTLMWDNVVDSRITGTRIERKAEPCTNPGAFTDIAGVAIGISTFTDKGVTEGQTYCYRARYSLTGGTFSTYSNTAQRTVPLSPVAPPSNLRIGGQ